MDLSDRHEVIALVVDGRAVEVPGGERSLLEVLRDELGARGPKDGCSPQGQCGCCTVLVDGAPRVACVTPVRRVAGRSITTIDGLAESQRWAEAFTARGASQCGFCTPGIIMRLEGLRRRGVGGADREALDGALRAHLCRCTGWQTIREAYRDMLSARAAPRRDWVAASRRAELEGGTPQAVGTEVALGAGGFADDTAPRDALVAVPDGSGGWAVAGSLHAARAAAGKVQGRRSTITPSPPLDLPDGEWDLALRTSWVEPGYLETDASWCAPGGEPASPLANGGAFGGKVSSRVTSAARELAAIHGRAVRVLYAREDCVRFGPKRPPLAAGLRYDGSGVVRVARTPGVVERIRAALPSVEVVEVDLEGPPTSVALRGAGWAEAAVLASVLAGTPGEISAPNGSRARARWSGEHLRIWVECGAPLDEVVLRSYCIGAAHMALGMVTSEALAVDPSGEPHGLTIRSFGILAASQMPEVEVVIEPSESDPVNGSDAVFAAVASEVWWRLGAPDAWPAVASSTATR